jgi:chemotaxis protein CheD
LINEQNSLVKENYFLKPGFIFLTAKATDISAVLGSCVSVCIYDVKLKAGGMSHFQLPLISEQKKATAVYGNVSTLALINMMTNEGSELNHLEAQIIGGAFNPEISSKDIGKDNVGVAKRILTKKQIRIVSMDAGGKKGRKVVFNTVSGDVAVLKVDMLRKEDWYPYKSDR